MNLTDKLIIEDYRKEKATYLRLGGTLQCVLEKICAEAGVVPFGIEHRVKTEKSLAGKLERRSGWFSTLADVYDVLGLRIICLFSDEIDKIGSLVEKTFVIDRARSYDRRALIKADSFGYLSRHYICSLPTGAGWPDELCGIQFEIQIRTLLQHAWAVTEHDLGYKTDFGVPRSVVREFSRIAGLLELADDEFVRTRNHMRAYTEEIRQKIAENRADDVLLDSISLNEYVKHNTKMQALLREIGNIAGAEISGIDAESYLVQLEFLGKKTLGDLQTMMEENRALALRLAQRSLAGAELDILSSTVGLRFLCRAELLNKEASEEKITEFLQLSLGTRAKAARRARYLLDTYAGMRGENTRPQAAEKTTKTTKESTQ